MIVKCLSATVLAVSIIMGCGTPQKAKEKEAQNEGNNATSSAAIIALEPLENPKSKIGDKFTVKITYPEKIVTDSAQVFINNKLVKSSKMFPITIDWDTKEARVGSNIIKTVTYVAGRSEISQRGISLVSNLVPKNYGYKVVKTFLHDVMAYTQGLIYDNGTLLEATGLVGQSSLRKVKLETGEVLQSFSVPDNMFGEGITIYKDKIIQLTWQNQTGLVYDKQSFKLLQRFSYPTEGWGITTVEDKLAMSDGTNNIYFLNPESYGEVSRIEVFDNNGPVDNLNELEFIEGEIYANIYQSDKIARIDPATGKVLAYINLKGILKNEDRKKDTDVLNGICWNPAKKELYVTGKKWPKLFQIELIP
jgi:glutaminyl-peptide cyclotransferase